ncbi:hypothetical protein [Hoeflea sp.]|uniref:hypothetical protein n=1 Tax=Hoeflea sp. TaxID=1940281 RepID=UPI00374961B1
MIITVAFNVKNHVEVMEGWPIKSGDMTFFLEREDNVLKRVCLAFSDVGIQHAPSITPPSDEGGKTHIKISGGEYAELAREALMSWQAVVSGLQIIDLDFDNYELRFRAENINEEPHVHVKSFKHSVDKALNIACDFEQVGRAFCVGPVSSDRIESTSHFREGRIAFEAGRYVDAYNNMFLFLETRYCDGKTGNDKQTDLLLKQKLLCSIIEQTAEEFSKQIALAPKDKFNLFKPDDSTRDKIKTLVLLRGKLRHHSLKSPHRWDPNKQNEHESAARFLGAVVSDIVSKESIDDIYAPATLEKFQEISVGTGYETKIKVITSRRKKERTLALEMSYPTTVVSSRLCLATVRNAIEACEKEEQLADTVRFEATLSRADLELFSLDFDVWAYTEIRAIEIEKPIGLIRCSFEHFRAGAISKNEFSIPDQRRRLTILDVWQLLRLSFDHIEQREPTTRIMSLKLFLNDSAKAIIAYRVGAQVKN